MTKHTGLLAVVLAGGLVGVFGAGLAAPVPAADAIAPPKLVLSWGGLDRPEGLEVDGAGRVLVADTSNDRVAEFNGSGGSIGSFGGSGTGDGQFNAPIDVARDAVGNYYVTDGHGDRVQKFGPSRQFLQSWETFAGGDDMHHPSGIAVDSAASVFVVDTFHDRILKFDSNGNLLTQWGGAGQFSAPFGIAVDGAGFVFVADTQKHRIQKFDGNGGFVAAFGTSGSGSGQFAGPRDVAVDGAGNIYVADTANHRVQMFDSAFNYLTQWGGFGSGAGQFRGPFGIDIDSAGSIYVVEIGNQRVQKFAFCTLGLTSHAAAFGAGGGQGSVQVTNTGECAWNAVSHVGWITVTAGASGGGSGSVQYEVDANPSASGRTGTVTIAGQTFTVSQAGAACTGIAVEPTQAVFDDGGGEGSFDVMASAACGWTAEATGSWLRVTGGGSGMGPGTVAYQVDPNTSADQRSAAIGVGGASVQVTQLGEVPCVFRIQPKRRLVGALGGEAAFQVQTDPGCGWAASPRVEWITAAPGSGFGFGPGTVRLVVEPNGDRRPRVGRVDVANRVVKVRQPGGTEGDPPESPDRLRLRIRGEGEGQRVVVRWRDRSDNEDGFLVNRRGRGDKNLLLALRANARRLVDGDVTPGLEYCYSVLAANLGGRSGAARACLRISGSSTATAVEAIALPGGEVRLDWQAPLDAGVRRAVERRVGEEDWRRIELLPAGRDRYVDGSAPVDAVVAYRLLACEGARCGSPSNVARAITAGGSTLRPPAGFVAEATELTGPPVEPRVLDAAAGSRRIEWLQARPTVRVYQDTSPWWGEDSVRRELEMLGLPEGERFFVQRTSRLAAGVPAGTGLVVLPSASWEGTGAVRAVNSPAAQAALTAFVEAGGVLLVHLADNVPGDGYRVPGLSGNPALRLAESPDCVVSHGHLEADVRLPGDARVLESMSFEGISRPVVASYPYGVGHVLVTTLALEHRAAACESSPVSSTLAEVLREALSLVE